MDDYSTLRAKTLGSAQEEEAVTVNTRALIDKVLARYSSENTTLRELLQNAADANANSVEVRFQSGGSVSMPPGHQPDFKELVKSKMQRMLVRNDGHSFRDEDWQRLKRIAEGNPDETKIGAFGVGFYSVFADCEEPFVSSGDQAMAFYWKGNSLFTRRAKLDTKDRYTTFFLEYREPSELPDLKDLCKFFATSLTFVRLSSISLYVDDHCLLSLQKKTSPSHVLQIPESINPITRDKLMQIARVHTESVQIDAKYMNVTHYSPPVAESQIFGSILSRLTSRPVAPKESIHSDLSAYTAVTIFLRIATATVNASVTPSFAKELERATKKPPPKTTKLAILSMSKDELDASGIAEIFSGVLPGKSGRVFIGFPTHQTTSIGAHISAPSVIPTVERENIDLNARYIRDWNTEMLRVAGILARIMYTDEMSALARRAERQKGQLEDLFDHAIHIMKQFTFTPSTPASAVGERIRAEFWGYPRGISNSIEVMSTRGVLPSDRVRLSSDVNFLVGLPLLPEKIAKEAHEFIRGLKELRLLTEITPTDIQHELQNQALSGAQQDLFLKWLAEKRTKGDLDDSIVQSLLGVAVATTSSPEDPNGDITIPIPLGEIKYYVNPNKLSPDVPTPSNCLPFQVTKALTRPQLMALGWEEIAILTWLKFICSPPHPLPASQNIELSPKFSAQVMAIVSKNWDPMTSKQKEDVVDLLKNRKCIPTKMGLRTPTEAYFNTVKLFQDLPLIVSMSGVRDKFLTALGVRKTVELKLVFERLMSENATQGGRKWSHLDLVRYLTSVWNDIPRDDITKLKNTAICKAETSSPQSQQNLYRVSELYEPDDQLRKLRLPILYWPNWKAGSPEGKFLTGLGLKKYPSAQDVLRIAAISGDDEDLREAALHYYVNNYYNNGYTAFNAAGLEMAFLPLKGGSQEKAKLAAPRHCYSNPRASIMGYDILRSDLQEHGQKFGVSVDPPMTFCIDKLVTQPPATIRDAQEKFSYFSTRLAEILPHLVDRLSGARIVPVPLKPSDIRPGSMGKLKWIPPKNCFLGGQGSPYYEIFDFVDLGQDANAFLTKCGSKHEPTVAEVAYMIVREPDRLLDVFGGEKKYMGALRSIAENWSHLKKDKMLVREMRKSRFLGALREVSAGNGADGGATEENADGGTIREFILARADQVLVIDEYVTYVMFKSEILTAPQEDILECFYTSLGSSAVSARVFPEWRIGNPIHAEKEVERLSKLVLERCRLFLHNNNEEVAHDARWLENNLRVSYVDTIRVKNTLKHEGYRTISHLQNKTAAITKDTVTKQTILYVTHSFSYYDVSVGLVGIILRRPKPHSYLLLESLLSTELMVLKSRGFNVDRILRAKAAEARLAESQRQRRLEEERWRFEEEEKLAREKEKLQQKQILREQKKQAAQEPEERPAMPGAFTESSPQGKTNPLVPPIVDRPRTNNFFGGITGALGFGKDSRQTEQIRNLLDYQSPEQQQQMQLPIKPTPHAQPQVEKPTEPHRIRENLRRAVESSRSHDSSNLFSPPDTFVVKEQKSYCDSRESPSHDITFAGNSALGIKLYVDKKVKVQDFFGKNAAAVNSFSQLLKEIAEIYSLKITSMHIYFDEQGTAIAFNTNGSIFCNLRFFLQLHAEAVAKGNTEKALAYWFVVVAHELAHNLVSDHSAQHSFYAETFVQEFFAEAMAAIQRGREAKAQLSSSA